MKTSLGSVVLLAVNTALTGIFVLFGIMVAVAAIESPPEKRENYPGLRSEARELVEKIDADLKVLYSTANNEAFTREEIDGFRKARASMKAAFEGSEKRFDPFALEKQLARFPKGIGQVPRR